MRFGMIAAAAATLVCTGQADAARYFEFQVSGLSPVSFADPNGGPATIQNVATTVTAAFDTIDPTSPFIAQGAGFATVYAPFFSRIYTLNQPAQTYFDLTFNAASIANSLTLTNIATTGTFGFYACDRGFCYKNAGSILSVSARTSDVAPAFLGSVQTFNLTPSVPEPSMWAMMILGLGAVGYAVRRRSVRFGHRASAISTY